MVAQSWRRAKTLAFSGTCVAPLQLGGRRGKQSTPRVWLGGTGERSAVGKRERQARGASIEARTAYQAGASNRYARLMFVFILNYNDSRC